ncbi:MAG: hypothetical protein ACQEQC_00620 [Elusimicrobiota bacterium]
MAKKRTAQVLKKFKDKNIVGISSSANFFGLKSRGAGQVRGNGILILTKNKIYFEMWMPKKVIDIPISRIVQVDTVRSHLKKTKFKPLLKITFTDADGMRDSAAWLVNNTQEWLDGIKKLSGKL